MYTVCFIHTRDEGVDFASPVSQQRFDIAFTLSFLSFHHSVTFVHQSKDC